MSSLNAFFGFDADGLFKAISSYLSILYNTLIDAPQPNRLLKAWRKGQINIFNNKTVHYSLQYIYPNIERTFSEHEKSWRRQVFLGLHRFVWVARSDMSVYGRSSYFKINRCIVTVGSDYLPNIKPVPDLRNCGEVLCGVSVGSPVFLTKNGHGRYAVIDIEEYKEYEKMLAWRRLKADPDEGRRSGETDGWLTPSEVVDMADEPNLSATAVKHMVLPQIQVDK